MELETTDITLQGLPIDGGFILAFVRVTPKANSARPVVHAPRRVSLIFLHAATSHKETWLPAIEHLFNLQHAAPDNLFTIVEAWSMDAPSHGRAAVRNDAALRKYPDGITGHQWASGVRVLLNSGLITGDTVVGVGHSAGACVVIESTVGYPLDRLQYSAMILVEPTMMTREILKRALEKDTYLLRAVEAARKRKDIWPSREAARKYFSTHLPWRRWDQRVLDLYIEHALCDLPTSTYPDKIGVTLAITRAQEAGSMSHHEDSFDALDILQNICPVLPVHTVFGEHNDMVPVETQEAIVSVTEGRRMKSIVRVAGAGHLVVQEDPRGTALAIWGILQGEYAQVTIRVPSHL